MAPNYVIKPKNALLSNKGIFRPITSVILYVWNTICIVSIKQLNHLVLYMFFRNPENKNDMFMKNNPKSISA